MMRCNRKGTSMRFSIKDDGNFLDVPTADETAGRRHAVEGT